MKDIYYINGKGKKIPKGNLYFYEEDSAKVMLEYMEYFTSCKFKAYVWPATNKEIKEIEKRCGIMSWEKTIQQIGTFRYKKLK